MGSETPDTVLTNMTCPTLGWWSSLPAAAPHNNGELQPRQVTLALLPHVWLQQNDCRLCLRMWIGIPHNTETSSAGQITVGVSALTPTIGMQSTCVSCTGECLLCVSTPASHSRSSINWHQLTVGLTPICMMVVWQHTDPFTRDNFCL